MAYADQKQNRSVALGSVVLVHAGLGIALISGFAVKFDREIPTIIEGINIPLEPPPLPEPPPPEPRTETPFPETVTPPVNAPVPAVRTTSENTTPSTPTIYPPASLDPPVLVVPTPPLVVPPVTPPPAILSRGLQPRGNQGDWFPQDSYPAAARRAGAEGRVGVSVDVGANGRVTACRVAVSSGNEDLDQATCRLAARNGRFVPALDAAGKAVPATITLRPVRWRLEQ